MRPLLVDLFCKAGGCAMGYHRAGFDVLGVDIEPQPNYPFRFHQADALKFLDDLLSGAPMLASLPLLKDVAAIHASPPCQANVKGLAAVNAALGRESRHRDLIPRVRERLAATGLPYVIENVEGAPLLNAMKLCGSSFGLAVRRHRLFECSFPLMAPPCAHHLQTEAKYWTGWRPNGETRLATVVQVYGNAGGRDEWPEAMGIDWMTADELAEAIPPAYTEHIGEHLTSHLNMEVAA